MIRQVLSGVNRAGRSQPGSRSLARGGGTARPAAIVPALFLFWTAMGFPAGAVTDKRVLSQIRFDQRLDARLPMNLPLTDEAGHPTRLGAYFGKTPVVLSLAYFHCPNLCPLVLDGMAAALKHVSFASGQQYQVVVVDIDPKEGPMDARMAHRRYLRAFGQPDAPGWHFLTATASASSELERIVGFHVAYDAALDQYAHPSGIMVATPLGRLSHYLYGIDYAPRDLRLALVQASGNRIGSPVDEILLICCQYNPATGKYDFAIARLFQVVGTALVALLGALIVRLSRRTRKEGHA